MSHLPLTASFITYSSPNENFHTKMTTADFTDCDNRAEDGCTSGQISIEATDELSVRPLFYKQRPKMASGIKPKSLNKAEDTFDDCAGLSDDEVTKGKCRKRLNRPEKKILLEIKSYIELEH